MITLDASVLVAARGAAELAAHSAVRGADAVDLQGAQALGTTLVTPDQEVIDRSPRDVGVITPRTWLNREAR